MKIICVGMSHHTASVEKREAVTFARSRFIEVIRAADPPHALPEMVLLSTCNRIELYASVESADKAAHYLHQLWAEAADIQPDDLQTITYTHHDQDAINHLLHVSAGLDSLVLGEPQILGQISDAFEAAQQDKLCGPWLRTLFRTAIRTGKRVRTETKIGQNSASISSVAVKLAEQHIGSLDGANIVLIGAGKMGVLALKSLQAYEIGSLSVVNRTRKHAQEAADQFDGTAYGFEHLQRLMETADLVVSSTGAPYTLLDCDFMQAVSEKRHTPLLILDIAVPRDVDPAVAHLPNITLFDIDRLQDVVDSALEQRRQEVPHVQAIISEEDVIFARKTHELEARPTITDLRAKAEQIRQREIARMHKSMPDADEATLKQVELLSQSLVKKLLHSPTSRLRALAGAGNAAEYTQTVRDLFALDDTND